MVTIPSQLTASELDKSPTVNADLVGRLYIASVSPDHKQRLGQYLTPIDVAMFMAKLYEPRKCNLLRVLDPGAGSGTLVCALCETIAKSQTRPEAVELVAYELDKTLARQLEACLGYTKRWLTTRGIQTQFTIYTSDFVLDHASALDCSPRLFPCIQDIAPFDVVISNPPYLKIPKSDPRAQAASLVVHGQPNLYALFMAVSTTLLKPMGQLIVISPRSYAAGPYFRLFRERFFSIMRPELIHLFGSRRDAFKRDQVLQENIILRARREDGWAKQPLHETVQVSFSSGIHDLSNAERREVPLNEILDWPSRHKVLRIPTKATDDIVARLVRSWPGSLHKYGLEISTGPVVPFRSTELLSQHGKVPGTHAPLLWMQNIHPMKVIWPTNAPSKPQYIRISHDAMPLLVADNNHVILRRFSAKEQHRRLTAAPLLAGSLGSPVIGLENHLNYIYRPGSSLVEEEAYGLAILLNSNLIDTYFRTFSGNTQVSATELRATPLPPLKLIIEIGRRALSLPNFDGLIDNLVEEALQLKNSVPGMEGAIDHEQD